MTAALLGHQQHLEEVEDRRRRSADRLAPHEHEPVTGSRAVAATPAGPDRHHELTDLPDEITWLVRVATAYTHSPLVRTPAAAPQEQERERERPEALHHQEVPDQP